MRLIGGHQWSFFTTTVKRLPESALVLMPSRGCPPDTAPGCQAGSRVPLDITVSLCGHWPERQEQEQTANPHRKIPCIDSGRMRRVIPAAVLKRPKIELCG